MNGLRLFESRNKKTCENVELDKSKGPHQLELESLSFICHGVCYHLLVLLLRLVLIIFT